MSKWKLKLYIRFKLKVIKETKKMRPKIIQMDTGEEE